MSLQAPDEGDAVVFCGPGWTEPSRGRLIATAGFHGQVRWDTGPYAGQITLAALDDLMTVDSPAPQGFAATASDLWGDSLLTASLDHEAGVTYDEIGDDEFLFGGRYDA